MYVDLACLPHRRYHHPVPADPTPNSVGNDIGHNKNGFFLAASSSVPWNDIYSAIAKALAKRGIVDDEKVEQADGPALEKMADAFQVAPSAVPVQLGGK